MPDLNKNLYRNTKKLKKKLSGTGDLMKKVQQLPVHLGINRYSPLNECTLQVPYMKSAV